MEKNRPPAAPFATIDRSWSAVSSSNTGGPGTGMQRERDLGLAGGATVSQRKLPISGTVTSSRTSIPSFVV